MQKIGKQNVRLEVNEEGKKIMVTTKEMHVELEEHTLHSMLNNVKANYEHYTKLANECKQEMMELTRLLQEYYTEQLSQEADS